MIPFVILAIDSQQDQAFMEQLYSQYNRLIFSEINKIVKNRWDAEDIVQTVLVKLIGKISLLQGLDRNRLVNYIIVASRNTAYNYLRDNKRETEFPFDETFDVPDNTLVSAEERLITMEMIESAGAAWQALDERSRRLLEMRYYLEKTDAEIAQEVGVAADSVRMLLTRARNKLRAAVARSY